MTRHNTGFMVLDAFAKASNTVFEDRRYGFVAETSLKGRKVVLLKPTTFMNLSGNAVRYWLNKENIDQQRPARRQRRRGTAPGPVPPEGQRLQRRPQRTGTHPAAHRPELPPAAHGHRQRLPAGRTDRLGAGPLQRRGARASCSLPSTWPSRLSRVSCWPASTSR